MAKELKHVGASASIVIPIRLQVTAATLTQIERFRTHLINELDGAKAHSIYGVSSKRWGITVHEVTIDDTTREAS